MRRILERGQIEAFAERAIPRVRLPDPAAVFAARAARLRSLAEQGAVGQPIADYLELMAVLADAQQRAITTCSGTLPGDEQIALARSHGMPPVQAAGARRQQHWLAVLGELCTAVAAQRDMRANVRSMLDDLRRAQPEVLERLGDALLASNPIEIDPAGAPFVMAALQVYWLDLASRLPPDAVAAPPVPGVCPACGTLPVASVVRTDQRSQGQRYLHCALCATEWHLVRVTCSHCQSTQGISYKSIEGGPEAIRAECCDACRTYRKILYQEKDPAVEPVADDLASLTLDLLLAEAGYRRRSQNPLLWQARPPIAG